MKIIQASLILIVSFLYYIYEGYREAYMYYYKINSKVSFKELHPTFSIQRSLYWLVILIYSKSLILCFALIFLFPIIHDGSYYITRNNLDSTIYKGRFKESSLTSTAIIELTYRVRVIMAIVGGLLFAWYIIKTILY